MKLKDFNLIAEHPDHYEIGHPKGRSIRVSKYGLSPEAHKQIKLMASGGGVSSLDQSESQMPTAPDELSQIEQDVANTPPNKGSADYQNDLAQQQLFNPGEPAQFQESSALDQALGTKAADQMAANRAANALFSQQNDVRTQNAKRAQLGLAPLPVPGVQSDQSDQAASSQAVPDQQQGPSPASVPPQTFPQVGQEQLLNQQQGNLGDYSSRLGQIAKNEQQVVTTYEQQQADLQKTSDVHFQQMQKDMNDDRKAIIDGKIDPNQFWNSRTGGQKAMGILSVILGGIGGALTHQQNPGVVLLNNAIDRDIQSQRDNLGKQNNLYSMELKRYGDERSAYVSTQAHMLNAMQAQLSSYGMQAQTAAQQASIGQAQQQIELQKMMLQRELSNRIATAQLYGAIPSQGQPGHQGGGIPTAQAGMYALNNPKAAENLINLDNGYSYQFKGTPENAQDFQNFEQTTGSVLDGINQLKKLGASAEIPGSDSNRKAQVILGNLVTQIPQMRSSQIGAKRISEVETENAKNLLPDPRKISGLVNSTTALNQFASGIQKEREDARRGNLIGYQAPPALRTFKPD